MFLVCRLVSGAAAAEAGTDGHEDRRIGVEANGSYNFLTLMQGWVSATAHEGVVTLSGSLIDPALRQLAEETVRGLAGVKRVENLIQVDTTLAGGSDELIALQVQARLLMRANVVAAHTRVTVQDGAVLLRGIARSEVQKRMMGRCAKNIPGVVRVKNDLVVEDSSFNSANLDRTIDDASITAQIKFTLATDDATGALRPAVETKDGVVVVTLGSEVSDDDLAEAVRLAGEVRGVRSVLPRRAAL